MPVKQPTKAPWLPLENPKSQFDYVRTGRGQLTRINGEHEGDRIVGLTETDFAYAVECVNKCNEEVNDPAVAAIEYASMLEAGPCKDFLILWNHGDFDLIRKVWPDAPDEVYIGADPLFENEKKVSQ